MSDQPGRVALPPLTVPASLPPPPQCTPALQVQPPTPLTGPTSSQPPTPQIILIQSPAPRRSGPRTYESYPPRASRALGLGRAVVGVLCLAGQIAAIIIDTNTSRSYYGPNTISVSGSGIWCGLFFILAGCIGVGSSKARNLCMIIANMVLAILSTSIFGLTHIIMSSIGVAQTASDFQRYYDKYGRMEYTKLEIDRPGLLAVFVFLLILAITQCVMDLLTSIICCKAVCCGRQETPNDNEEEPQIQCMTTQQAPMMYINHGQVNQAFTPAYPSNGAQYMGNMGYPSPCPSPIHGGTPPPAYTETPQTSGTAAPVLSMATGGWMERKDLAAAGYME